MSVIKVESTYGCSRTAKRLMSILYITSTSAYWWNIIICHTNNKYDSDDTKEFDCNVAVISTSEKSNWAIRSSYFARFKKG